LLGKSNKISGKITAKKTVGKGEILAEYDNVDKKDDNEILFEKHLWHGFICVILIYKVFLRHRRRL